MSFLWNAVGHSDGAGRAYHAAKMAADAFLAYDLRLAVFSKGDSLMSSVAA